jgi:transformation/transcription domain-associated protein
VKLDRIGPDVPIVRRHGSSFRRLSLIGSDGSQRHFIVQTSLTPNARSDERMLQLFRILNKMFDKDRESRRHHLAINTPIIIPVWSQVGKLNFFFLILLDTLGMTVFFLSEN